MLKNITSSLRIIVYGTWASDWMQALGPHARLWINHPNVREVVVWNNINNDPTKKILKIDTDVKSNIIHILEDIQCI